MTSPTRLIDVSPTVVYRAIVDEMDGETAGKPVRTNEVQEGASFAEARATIASRSPCTEGSW